MKFLIIRFSSIGDIVLTTPVIRCLKKQIATAEVHFLTKYSFRYLVESNPYIDKCHFLHDDVAEITDDLKNEDFDYVIDLHHNLRSLTVKRQLGKKSFSFNKLNVEKWLLTTFKWNRLPDVHIVDRYLETIKSFGIRNDGTGLDYFIPDHDLVKENDIPASHLAGYIGVVIGAALNTKKYPLHKVESFCKLIDHPIMLLGGKEDAADGEKIAAIDPVKIYNACGKFRINESADLVRRAKLLVTNDTGLMHIATAFKRPVISLWGNTVPEFGMYPYYGENYLKRITSNQVQQNAKLPYDILELKNLKCRPCSKIGYKKCPLGHFKCMEQIDEGILLKTVKEHL
ncbi:MAG: glycosyltransferase family 9 protein [Chitinophagaceae bacterium]